MYVLWNKIQICLERWFFLWRIVLNCEHTPSSPNLMKSSQYSSSSLFIMKFLLIFGKVHKNYSRYIMGLTFQNVINWWLYSKGKTPSFEFIIRDQLHFEQKAQSGFSVRLVANSLNWEEFKGDTPHHVI